MTQQVQDSQKHASVTLTVGEWSEKIDVEIAPLIRELWRADIETIMSCQEVSPGTAWIEFAEMEELIRFLNLVTRCEPGADTLHNRICHQVAGPMLTPQWEFQLNLWDMFEGQEEQTAGSVNFFASIGVYFPTSDIPLLTERLRTCHASD